MTTTGVTRIARIGRCRLAFVKQHLLIVGALLAAAGPIFADDFSGEAFSLRLPAALSRFSSYADVAAKGGASGASKFGSSENPATIAWSFPSAYDYGLSGQYSNVAFDSGTRLNFFTEVATVDANVLGTFRFALAHIRSNDHALDRSPLAFTYDLNLGRLDWAKRVGSVSLGAGFSYAESETTFRTRQTVFADASRQTSSVWLGALWQPASRWLVGVFGNYGYAPTRTDSNTPTLFGLQQTEAREITRQIIVRPGISYEWREHAMLQLDYEYGRFWNDTGSLDAQRFRLGGDLPLARFFFVRGGAIADTRGNLGWSAGCGFYPHTGVTFDFAYQNDVFPEIQREFSHSRTLNASMSVQF